MFDYLDKTSKSFCRFLPVKISLKITAHIYTRDTLHFPLSIKETKKPFEASF